jgi:N-acetylglucosamine-6-phosphate deacetylase
MLHEMKIIDIHTHGIGGYDTRTTTKEHILKIAEIHGSYGVSDILLTVYPSSIQEMRRHMETIRKSMQIQQSLVHSRQPGSEKRNISQSGSTSRFLSDNYGPATISGIHLEGPFLNPVRCGSLNAEACMKPTEYALKDLTEGFLDTIKIITIAPEMPGALSLMRKISDMGIAVSMGHSDATYAEAEEGFHAGAKGITHIFNAMRSFHHREPGIAGFGLSNQDIYIEIIADPFHLHDRVIELIFRIKNPDKIIIISDTVRETDRGCRSSGIRDERDKLLGGSMAVTESAQRLIKQGYEDDVIMKCITENPQTYLLHLH